MRLKMTLLLCFISLFGYSQNDWNKMAKSDLMELFEVFKTKKEKYLSEKEKLTLITNNLSEDPKEQFDITLELKKELDTIYKTRTTFIDYYLSKKVVNDSLQVYFPEEQDYNYQGETESEEPIKDKTLPTKTVYFLFGDNNLIKEEDLIKNKEINQIFSKVINEKSEANLGKFEIPAVGQLIPVYYKVDKKTNDKDENTDSKNKKPEQERKHFYISFEEVNITIKEGALEDIRVILIDKKENKKYYFENRLSASLLRNTRNGKNFSLLCSFVTSIDNKNPYKHDQKVEECYIFLKDVLQYEPNSGNNYVPDDQNLIFPLHNGKDIQKLETRGVYNLVQNTSLQNTVELRTYTDFLGLFNDSPNGIVQIEGRAEFFMVPFRVSSNNSIYFFKKITPYINYSKIDETSRGLDLVEQTTTPESTFTIKTPLQIFEKSYLELGVNFNIVSFKFTKEMPFKVNINFPLRYNATSVYQDRTDNTNFKMVSYGGGLNFEFKKFSNFGFNYSVEYTNSRSINKSEVIINPSSFWVFRNEAELFYYPGESKNQSIFTRFRTFYNSKDNRDSFFQLQFGYRFSIGAGKVKS